MRNHGWVTPNPDGSKARCGGPKICKVCAIELAQKNGTPTMSKPEWKVTYINGNVEIRSNNFTHDAVLYLTGDFATHEVAISYAEKLAARLNADFQCADGGHCGDGGYCDECPHRNTNEKHREPDGDSLRALLEEVRTWDLNQCLAGVYAGNGIKLALPLELRQRIQRALGPVKEAAPDTDVPTPTELVDGYVMERVAIAYGYLWHVNNEPGTPQQYPPGRAAYEARKLLRDLMTNEQRGQAITKVRAMIQAEGGVDEALPVLRI